MPNTLTALMERRDFVRRLGIGLAAAGLVGWGGGSASAAERGIGKRGSGIKFGLVTWQWGKDWDLRTLIRYLEAVDYQGVELRTTHAHGVEPDMNASQRREVRELFQDSPVRLVGLGSNERFDHPDRAKLKEAIEATKRFIVLSHDVGGSGVKVKPDSFHKGVSREETIEQIGRSLNEVGRFGEGYGQQIRVEVHGQCAPAPIMKQIMDVASHPNVAVCWNSNDVNARGGQLAANLELLKDRFGATCHVRDLDTERYPFQKLINALVEMDYNGYCLIEAGSERPENWEPVFRQLRERFFGMVQEAQRAAAR